MFRKIQKKVFWNYFNTTKSQYFYEELLRRTMLAMNYGNNGSIKQSGELFALQYVYEKASFINIKKPILFDIGANIGEYTKEMCRIWGNHTEIHAFEPSKYTFELLKKNVEMYPNVKVNNVGCSNVPEKRIMFTDTDGSGITSIYQRRVAHYNIHMDKYVPAEFVTVDDYCEQNDISNINFMKIDVEGHELSVLQGSSKMLSNKKIDYIQFEFGGTDIDSRTFFQDFWYLLHDNYRIYRILQNGLHEITEYNERCELFEYVNYLAVLK